MNVIIFHDMHDDWVTRQEWAVRYLQELEDIGRERYRKAIDQHEGMHESSRDEGAA